MIRQRPHLFKIIRQRPKLFANDQNDSPMATIIRQRPNYSPTATHIHQRPQIFANGDTKEEQQQKNKQYNATTTRVNKNNVCNTTQCNNDKIQKNTGKKTLKNM